MLGKEPKSSILMLEVDNESQKKTIEEEVAKVKELHERVILLELEYRPSFEGLRNKVSHEASIGSLHIVIMEEDTVEQCWSRIPLLQKKLLVLAEREKFWRKKDRAELRRRSTFPAREQSWKP